MTMIAIVPKAKPRASKVAEAFAESSAALSAQAEIAPIDQNNPDEVVAFAKEKGINLVVIGPEAPLVVGVADAIRQAKQATSRKKLLDKIQIEDIQPSTRRYPFVGFEMEREVGNQILEVNEISINHK